MQRSNVDVGHHLTAAATRFGFELEAPAVDRLRLLLGLWQRFGRAFNLSGASDEAGLLGHVLEGLQVVGLAHKVGYQSAQRWLDVGSGAGFPGLVIAACLEVQVTLVEPRERRASFLDLAVNQIGRRDCRVLRGHIEGASWRPITAGETVVAGSFDWASARAVFAPEVWVELGKRWVKPGGVVVAHVKAETGAFHGEVGRVDDERWSIRGVRGG
ncbi:16S rRNA (guanine527-N7)-methyltransferase [Nannocystis exedens]|uniref:Ribosomal RNA small subunit methyltransferase G n=1 Tax=Nannocystis exedens TaxID=54 RepID=A0A1I1X0T3_9BACT|nr:RsmG family class I SAM-dependent methyltransferase [Nannocystis exedens]PCC70963.1 methyltransferase GidB [Nannocystis exedens]SFD99303.1 16S rRNA (guanine527-N7)-methyltransferase [Nannocystis exedens]